MKLNIDKLIEGLKSSVKKKLKKIKMPDWIDPMLATLTENYFSSNDYMYEHKWDGERIIAYKNKDNVRLMTRNKIVANKSYPTLVKDMKIQPIDNIIIDGEVIAEKHGKSNFSILQKRMHTEPDKAKVKTHIYYYVFDILYLDQYDLTDLELIDRKYLLENSVKFTDELKFTEYKIGNGLEYFKRACKLGWEGLIVKDIHSKYEKKRSKSWLKFKCIEQQELVIGGYTEPQGSRVGFGAILVGYYKDGKLLYAGKVGTGFDRDTLKELKNRFAKIEQKQCPFTLDLKSKDKELTTQKAKKTIHWLKPKLVAEIKFSQWTPYNKLRHPRFMGIRDDKDAKAVIKEVPRSQILK